MTQITAMNLDLTETATEDVEGLATKIESFYKGDSSIKSQLSWNWERNHLMLDGKQWIIFEGSQATGGMWKPLKVSKQNEYIPRPVTNYLFDTYQTLKSYLIKNKPRSTVFPNTETYKDKVAAKIGTMCLEANWSRLREQQNYEYAAATLLTYGTVFKKDFWEASTINTVTLPKMQEVPQVDPNTGMPAVSPDGMPLMKQIPMTDDAGNPITEQLPLGDCNTDVIEPYRIALDPLAMDLHKARWIMEYSIQPLPWIREVYGKQAPGYTGLAAEVKEETQLSNPLRRFFNLKHSSGVRNNLTTSLEGSAAADFMVPNSAVLKEYWERPCQAYPNGRLIVVANGITLYAGDSPYSGNEQGDWHPYSECRWELVPGRFWGRSPFDDAVEVQKQINSIDSLIVLTRKTMAMPQKLIPQGMGIAPGQWTGRPGQEIFYKETGSGSMPSTVAGSGVHEQVFQERAQRVDDLKTITGAMDILKGDRPPGVNAASALSLLYEVGTGKLFPILDRWKAFVEGSQRKQLKIIQKYYKEPRADFIRMLQSKNTELDASQINQFIGTDLYDNVNVQVEAGSNVPKLQAAHQARLMELAQMGVLGLEQPANKHQFLEDLGVAGYDADVGPDIKRAEWENALLDNLLASPDNKPIVLDADIHEIHIDTHKRRQKEPSFLSLPSEVQQAYLMHIQQHEQMIQQAQIAMMHQQQALGPAGPPGAPPQQGGGGLQPAGKGITKEMKNAAMGADVLAGSVGGKPQ